MKTKMKHIRIKIKIKKTYLVFDIFAEESPPEGVGQLLVPANQTLVVDEQGSLAKNISGRGIFST